MLNLKRIIDIFLSSVAILLMSPILILISLLILFYDGRPIFFIQERPGLDTKIFKMIKFKSMSCDTSERNFKDKDRITKLGKFLRNSSLDELPELFNVVKGDMSLVGPRPLLIEYLKHYDNFQNSRHKVRPGITGWAQVNGRNAIDWQTKFKLDVWYVENKSLFLDLKILFLTLKKVLSQDGISEKGEATMSKFKGNTQ
jgi:lipopolysaccharide/colanic/teichoic acid biosynthesis glycosyltransferase